MQVISLSERSNEIVNFIEENEVYIFISEQCLRH